MAHTHADAEIGATGGYRRCTFCAQPGSCQTAVEVARVHSNVRRFRGEAFTLWRCTGCRSIHCVEDIDFARYYEGYPMNRRELDAVQRLMLRGRLRALRRAGLRPDHALLDYGCGNGLFVRYLRERGYDAHGFDPFGTGFDDRRVLDRRYDVVMSQDVVEHVPDPRAHLRDLAALVRRSSGRLAIGTPDAERLDLRSRADAVSHLHAPYHRHLLSAAVLTRLVEEAGLRIVSTARGFYIDTWVPFLNAAFLFAYIEAVDGTIDAWFEPVRHGLVLRSPRLLALGLFGRLVRPMKDVMVFAAPASPAKALHAPSSPAGVT